MESPAVVQAAIAKIKLRAILIGLVIHAGLVAAVVGVALLPRPEGMELAHWLTIGGLVGIYGGLALGILMVVLPLMTTIRRVRKLLQWRDWILDELPRIVALMPSVLEAIRAFFQALARGGTVFSAMGEAAKQAGQAAPPAPGAAPGMTTEMPPAPGAAGQKPPQSVA